MVDRYTGYIDTCLVGFYGPSVTIPELYYAIQYYIFIITYTSIGNHVPRTLIASRLIVILFLSIAILICSTPIPKCLKYQSFLFIHYLRVFIKICAVSHAAT